MSILSICLSPGLQRTVMIGRLLPGEVNRLESVQIDVAGKGVNACRVLHTLGFDAVCLGQGGENAEDLLALTRREGLDLRLIPSTGRLRTCTTIIETGAVGGYRVTELVEPNSPVAPACVEALTQAVRERLPQAPALIIAGSMAPGFPADYQAQIAHLADEDGVPVFIDLQGAPLKACLAARPAVVKINLSEFAATFLAGRFSGGEQSGVLAQPALSPEVMRAVADVSSRHATRFVLTRGAQSVLLASAGEVREIPVAPMPAASLINPIGSGDSFLAGLLAHLLERRSAPDWRALSLEALEEAVDYATDCAQSNARTARPGFLEEGFVRLRG